MRVTIAVATILRIFLEDIAKAHYGYDLMQKTKFPSGKLYPILDRLHDAGWLVREHEDIDPAAAGRPARRMYRLTSEGTHGARQALAELNEQLRLGTPSTTGLHPEAGPA